MILALGSDVTHGRETLGGKAWSLVQMLRLGIPVPPAFALTTDECSRYELAGDRVPDDVLAALPEAMRRLEEITGRTFGAGERPLLVSVRSGAPTSMPGMMDTILNLGMTADVEAALARLTGDQEFAAGTRTRFEEQYAEIVGAPAPAGPWDQLAGAIAAVFGSWRSRRAITYRRERGLDEDGGTAVTVQAMVFGNLDDLSGTGVLFTRNPLTGTPESYGEWLPRAQGEDVVSGRFDPLGMDALAHRQPAVHAELMELAERLEQDGCDAQDIEFTVESGRLWLLQARAAKRTAQAAVRLAVLFAREGLIDEATALDRVTPEQVAALLGSHVDPAARAAATVLATGRPASPGVVSGIVVADVDEAEERALDGEDIVLARATTNPDDVHAMAVVGAILTEIGGSTSHAAVVSRELDVPCIVGCGAGTVAALDGRTVTVDASAGEVLDGALPIVTTPADDPDIATLCAWARAEAGADAGAGLPALLAARAAPAPAPVA